MEFGIYTTAELYKLGYSTKSQLRAAIELQQLTRLRRGIYATPDAHPEVAKAIQLGGSIGCLRAASIIGLWVPPHSCRAIIIPANASVPRSSVSFHRARNNTPTTFPRIQEILWQVARNHDAETAAIVIESALNLRQVRPEQVQWVLRNLPKHTAQRIRQTHYDAQSGSETRVRRFLESRRVNVRTQVFIPSVGRVDLLVGRSLIIECDSRTHHSSPINYEEDRRRDLAAHLLGFTVLRLSYRQIWSEWSQTQVIIDQILATKRHKRTPISISERRYGKKTSA